MKAVEIVDPREIMPVEITEGTYIFGLQEEPNDMTQYIHHLHELPYPYCDKQTMFYEGDPWVNIISNWVFGGIRVKSTSAKPGIDENAAARHISALLKSWAISCERKILGAAYLMSQWYDEFEIEEVQSDA